MTRGTINFLHTSNKYWNHKKPSDCHKAKRILLLHTYTGSHIVIEEKEDNQQELGPTSKTSLVAGPNVTSRFKMAD